MIARRSTLKAARASAARWASRVTELTDELAEARRATAEARRTIAAQRRDLNTARLAHEHELAEIDGKIENLAAEAGNLRAELDEAHGWAREQSSLIAHLRAERDGSAAQTAQSAAASDAQPAADGATPARARRTRAAAGAGEAATRSGRSRAAKPAAE